MFVTAADPIPHMKDVVCKHYKKGWCRKGHACKFHHGDLPASVSRIAKVDQEGKVEGRKICPHFLKGNCLRGESCGYVHTQNAVSPVSRREQPTQETRARCPHFSKGFCRRGESCGFAHVPAGPSMRDVPPQPEADERVKRPPLAQSKKEQLREAGLLNVCFRWAQGGCDTKACRFSHKHLEPWEIKMFKELLDSNEVLPTALPASGQVPLNTSPTESSGGKPQEDKVSEGHRWDITVPLFRPAPLLLEPSVQDKCRLSASRPTSSLRKGVKVSMPGSTILRRKLGDHSSTRIVPLSSQPPPCSVLNQPCVFASPGPPEKVPQRQRTWGRLRVSRSCITGHLKSETRPDKVGVICFEPPWNATKTAPSHKDVTTPMKGEPGKQSVFRRAWADMSDSDSSEEATVACELPPLPPQFESSSGRRALTGLSGNTYKRLRQYAFWKVRKRHGHQCPKDPNPCNESSSDSQSVAHCYESLSRLSFVHQSAHQNDNGTGEGSCTLCNVPESVTQATERGEVQDNVPVSRCVLRAVWSQVAVRGLESSVLSQPSFAGTLQHAPRHGRDSLYSPVQTARACARGRSLTPKPERSTPKPVFNHPRASSLTFRTSWSSPGPVSCPTSPKSSDHPVKFQSGSCAVQLASQKPGLGGDPSAQKENSHLLVQSLRTERANSRSCPGEAPFKELNFGDVVVGSGVPRKDHIVREFDSTKGFAGEGPPVPQPCTPPKGDRQPKTPPKTPPKAADPSLVPPWTLELEEEVRGVVDSYLQRGKAKSGLIITESRRVLGPPPKPTATRPTLQGSVRKPPEPPAPRARAKVSEAGDSRLILAGPRAGVASLTPPPPRVQPEQSRVVKPKFDTGFCYPSAQKAVGMPTGTVSFSGTCVSLQENSDLPGIRPSMPLNLDRRLSYEEAKRGSSAAQGTSEPSVIRESTSIPKAKFARPTPKVRRQKDTPLESAGNAPPGEGSSEALPRSDLLSMPSSGPAGKPVSVSSARAGSVEGRGGGDDRPEFSTVQGSALDTGELSSSSSELEVRSSRDVTDKGLLTRDVYFEKGSPEPANPKLSPPSVSSPEPANPKVPPPLVDGPEPTSPNPIRPEPVSAQASRIPTLFNVSDSRQPDSLKGAQPPIVGLELDNVRRPQALESRPGPSNPEDLCPPGSNAEPFGHEETRAVVTIPESTSTPVPEQAGSEPSKGRVSGGELLETSTVSVQPYQVSVKLEADLERGAEWRRLSWPEQAGVTIRAHQTRRVLEALLLSWKPGSCLGHLTRVMSENLVSVDSRSAVTLRDRMGQMVVGSTIIASFVPDPEGPEVVVNSPVIQRLMACSQLTANACSRCDPTAPSVWLRSVSRPRDAFVMDMQMRLRVVPAGTLCRDILRALDRQDHPLVVLCRSLEHWLPLPAQYKVGPGWVVLQWPVPNPAAA